MGAGQGKTTRRQLIKGGVAATFSSLIAGCGNNEEKNTSKPQGTGTPLDPSTANSSTDRSTATKSETPIETDTKSPTNTEGPTETSAANEYILDAKPGEEQPDFVESIVFSSHGHC